MGAVPPSSIELHLLVPVEVVALVLVPHVGEVVQHPQVGAVEGVEASPGRRVLPGTEAKVPLADHVGGVASLLQERGQHGEAGGHATRSQRLQGTVLSAQVVGVSGGRRGWSDLDSQGSESKVTEMRIGGQPAGEQRRPAGSAHLLHIALVEDQACPGQLCQPGL